MIAIVRNGCQRWLTGATVRLLLQAVVSAALLVFLIGMVRRTNVLASLGRLPPSALLLAVALNVGAFVLNSRRWQVLLRNVHIREALGHLTSLYFISQFFSMFLPGSVGGDAVRAYDVARRSKQTPQAVLATMQERLLGLGASLLVGVVAMFYYLPLVPVQLRILMVLVLIGGTIGVALMLYPALLFGVAVKCWRAQAHRPLLRPLVEQPLLVRIRRLIRSVAELPPLAPAHLLTLLLMALSSVLLGIGIYYVLGQALQIHASFMAYCLVIPMVWIVRLAPVSLNGVGVAEGSLVFLMSLFAVPTDNALALALAFLGVQTGLALFGGVLLAVRMARGTWSSAQAT